MQPGHVYFLAQHIPIAFVSYRVSIMFVLEQSVC